MIQIRNECTKRGITRLCHFTQSRNLAHILGDYSGVLSRQTLTASNLPHNPTDPNRYDGCKHLICCSISYPNVYYFANARTRDILFKDWVVLLIHPNRLWAPATKFCHCNAATESGKHIKSGYQAFRSLFDSTYRTRGITHLKNAPTDIQAEVLVEEPIPLDYIVGIAVETEDQAKREICRLKLQNIATDKPIIIAPDFFSIPALRNSVQTGRPVDEQIYEL